MSGFFQRQGDLDATKRCVTRKLRAQQLMFEGAGAPVRHAQVSRVTAVHACRLLAKRCKSGLMWQGSSSPSTNVGLGKVFVAARVAHFGEESAVRPMSIIQDTAGF